MRKCMFCGEKASTREDVWPVWLMSRFPISSTARLNAECGGRTLGNWPTPKPKLQVRRLCASCNNGWMSKLENEAKPVLESILDDKLKDIDVSAQLTVARWGVKTAMVLDVIESNRRWFYSDDERKMMRVALSVPRRTSVWIAKCVNQPNIYSAAKDLRTSPGDNEVHAFTTTMAFGSLALQVVSIKTPVAIPENVTVTYDVREGPWDQTLVQMWPTNQNSKTWPPPYGLAGEFGLDALTERLSPTRFDSKKGR
jgi:hypothetical protein